MLFDIRDYCERSLDRAKDSSSDELTSVCPSCGKWGKFYVNVVSGSYVCFSCEFRGRSIVYLVAFLEDCTPSEARAFIFRKSVRRRKESVFTLSDRARGLRLHAVGKGGAKADEVVDFELPRAFRPVYDGKRWCLPSYLKERGIKSRTARAWGMGFCRVGFYAGRLVIPIECPAGKSWTARDMTGEQDPKYLNPKGADHRRLLIGWNMARLTGDVVLVEGPLDAVRLWQHDVSALALGGKELHDAQRRQLMRLPEDIGVTVMLDPEEREAPWRVAEKLSSHFRRIFLAKLPDGVDPGDSTRAQAHDAIDRAARWRGDRVKKLSSKLEAAKEALISRYTDV